MIDGGIGVYRVVAAAVVFPTLLAAGCHHLLHTGRLALVLRLHGWSARLSRPGSVLVALTETVVGAVGAAGVVSGSSGVVSGAVNPLVALAATLVFSAYAVDAARVLRSGSRGEGESEVPCGCGAVDHPVNQWVVVRAMVYACLAGVAALPRPALGALVPAAVVTATGAAMVIGLLLWLLPRTLAIPAGFTLRP